MEIYKEDVMDLLNGKKISTLREDVTGNVVAVGLEESVVTTEEQLLSIMDIGNKKRKVAETKMNERSSRSHSIFRLVRKLGAFLFVIGSTYRYTFNSSFERCRG